LIGLFKKWFIKEFKNDIFYASLLAFSLNLKSTEEHTLSYFINFSLLHLVQGSEGTLNRGSVS